MLLPFASCFALQSQGLADVGPQCLFSHLVRLSVVDVFQCFFCFRGVSNRESSKKTLSPRSASSRASGTVTLSSSTISRYVCIDVEGMFCMYVCMYVHRAKCIGVLTKKLSANLKRLTLGASRPRSSQSSTYSIRALRKCASGIRPPLFVLTANTGMLSCRGRFPCAAFRCRNSRWRTYPGLAQ